MRQHWDAVLFDLDGTLADSIELILHCYRHTMRTHLGHVPPDHLWQAGIGTPIDTQLAAFARSDEERLAMRQTYREFQHTIHDDMVRAYPGVVDGLARIASLGIGMAIVTSKSRNMAQRTLRVCGIEDRFNVVVSPEDVERGKPDPEPVLRAIERLGAMRTERVLFVGDAPTDVLAGRAAGVRTAAATWGTFPLRALTDARPDFMLRRFEDITDLAPDA